jgi:hypothetical protein
MICKLFSPEPLAMQIWNGFLTAAVIFSAFYIPLHSPLPSTKTSSNTISSRWCSPTSGFYSRSLGELSKIESGFARYLIILVLPITSQSVIVPHLLL